MRHQQLSSFAQDINKSEQNLQTELPQIGPLTPQKARAHRGRSNRLPDSIIESFQLKEKKSPKEIQEYLKNSIKKAGSEVRMKFRLPAMMNFKLSRDISHLQVPLSLRTERNWAIDDDEYTYD
jgi:hypothetical protein